LPFFRPDLEFQLVPEQGGGKLLGVGSIMRVLKEGDLVWGSGIMRETDEFPQAKACKFLAVRGNLTRGILERYRANVPQVYGDPALLLPLMYSPTPLITHEVGIIPHFVDEKMLTSRVGDRLAKGRSWKQINICQDYENFVNEVLTCKYIISSSLHGLIIAEAYGIPVEWVVLSDKVLGQGFKFRDYLSGTGRRPQGPGPFPILDPAILKDRQNGLLKALKKL